MRLQLDATPDELTLFLDGAGFRRDERRIQGLLLVLPDADSPDMLLRRLA